MRNAGAEPTLRARKLAPGQGAAFILAPFALALAGCASASHTARAARPAAQPGEAAAPLTPAGAAETLAPDANENLAWAASVVKVDYLRNQTDTTVKLFGIAGGDPAMNGLYTYLAFHAGPGDGWRVFKVGDFLEYRILDQRPGRLLLAIEESVMDAESNISARRRRLTVAWTRGADGAPPTSVMVTGSPDMGDRRRP